MVEQAAAAGLVVVDMTQPIRETAVTVRAQKTDEFITISLADDAQGILVQVIVTPAVKKLLKKYIK